jgi:hypothetical protein
MTELLHSLPPCPDVTAAPWPARVVCGVDGTDQAREAVRQAAELAGPDGRLEKVINT